MKSFLKSVLYTTVQAVWREPGAVVLVYHSIGENTYRFTVSPREFEWQMRWLRERGFNVVSLEQLAAYRKSGRIPPKTVSITFDDGYRDNYTIAFPILRKYDLPATIFITTNDIGGRSGQAHIELPKLSEAELHELDASGLVAIEPHSVSHPKFTELSEEAALREARESKIHIEKLLGKPCVHFAYPKGRHNAVAHRAVASAGIAYAYGTAHGKAGSHNDDYALPRNGIDSTTTRAQFKAIARIGRLASPLPFPQLSSARAVR